MNFFNKKVCWTKIYSFYIFNFNKVESLLYLLSIQTMDFHFPFETLIRDPKHEIDSNHQIIWHFTSSQTHEFEMPSGYHLNLQSTPALGAPLQGKLSRAHRDRWGPEL